MNNDELKFNNLYEECIRLWPEKLIFKLKTELSQIVENHPDGYKLIKCEYGEWDGIKNSIITHIVTSDGREQELIDLEEEITEKCSKERNILLSYLNGSIAFYITQISPLLNQFYLKDLRKNIVNKKLKSQLKEYVLNDTDPGWPKESIELVHEYFRVNYPDQEV